MQRCIDLRGQFLFLQRLSSYESPSHSFPPNCAGGLSHILVLTMVPEPQVALHSVNCDHVPHCPSTIVKKNTINEKLFFKKKI